MPHCTTYSTDWQTLSQVVRNETAVSCLPGQLPRPMRQEQHVGLGQLVLADAPRHRFDPNPAGPAIYPPHAIEQHHHAAPQRHKLEPAQAQVIIGPAPAYDSPSIPVAIRGAAAR